MAVRVDAVIRTSTGVTAGSKLPLHYVVIDYQPCCLPGSGSPPILQTTDKALVYLTSKDVVTYELAPGVGASLNAELFTS
jgi:hypothetical protein